ncbi:hypothetical protein DIPPA_07368 [Diplonema papillatum]|nr:hypothetical protein DIPPA_07368 [Diplonema papillatum]
MNARAQKGPAAPAPAAVDAVRLLRAFVGNFRLVLGEHRDDVTSAVSLFAAYQESVHRDVLAALDGRAGPV